MLLTARSKTSTNYIHTFTVHTVDSYTFSLTIGYNILRFYNVEDPDPIGSATFFAGSDSNPN